jgi:DNA polymerase-3 subunit epsilon
MSLILFYDTETTGLPLFKEPSEHPGQPHIVQLAAALVDENTRKIIQSIDLIIKPDGYEIPEEMTAIHGIDTAFASAYGVSFIHAMSVFLHLWDGQKRVAYNESFDARIVRIAQHRLGVSEKNLDEWKLAPAECCMKMANQHTKLGKFPKLIEAYRHFFGEDFDNAHSAMADVKACIAVYFAIKDKEAA